MWPVFVIIAVVVGAAVYFLMRPGGAELPKVVDGEPLIEGQAAEVMQEQIDNSFEGTGAKGTVGVYGTSALAPSYAVVIVDAPSSAGTPDIDDPEFLEGFLSASSQGLAPDESSKVRGSGGGTDIDCYDTRASDPAAVPAVMPSMCMWVTGDDLVMLVGIDADAQGMMPVATVTADQMAA